MTKIRRIPRELRRASKAATRQGWRVEVTNGGHLRWVPPDPEAAVVITSVTPGRGRATRNALVDLQRAGLQL